MEVKNMNIYEKLQAITNELEKVEKNLKVDISKTKVIRQLVKLIF